MDWKLFLAVFVSIFTAELADKTQFVGITMSSQSGKPWVVWMGSVAGYMVVTAISVFLGSILGKYLKPEIIKYVGGSLFMLIGGLMIMGKL
ncbi:MAG: hypothetical protein A2252_01565 [Elusimicrobia bacterium RIFOXYA2_FULL_39_19]|nr:MAG: hypothetical protein A2252_01565 [Elusimicrobia bacterium RIFOXYA2_FULL_39_19]